MEKPRDADKRGQPKRARKLTAKDVEEIRAAKGRQIDIAVQFQISQAHVSMLRARVRCWKD